MERRSWTIPLRSGDASSNSSLVSTAATTTASFARGHVVHRVEDVDAIETWRSEIKCQARADKIKVRTGANERTAWLSSREESRPEGAQCGWRIASRSSSWRRRPPHTRSQRSKTPGSLIE